jgi:UDP:flavonoid glycosyltransferase YjiC (YdhE family)
VRPGSSTRSWTASSLRPNQVFAGPALFDGTGEPAPGPERTRNAPPPEPGTVLVSTTSADKDGGFLRRVVEALAPLGIPILATAGGADDLPAGLPPHIRLERFVSHERVLPHVAALVTHAGAGVVGRAMRHGIPILAIPIAWPDAQDLPRQRTHRSRDRRRLPPRPASLNGARFMPAPRPTGPLARRGSGPRRIGPRS